MRSRSRCSIGLTVVILAGTALLATPTATQAQAGLKWEPAPAVFPPGAKMAVVSGDPSKAGPFVVQLSMPDNYSIAPHFHPTDENITVVSGMFSVGMGDKVDEKSMKMLNPGEKASMPANMHHYAKTMGNTVVEVSSMGPFQMTYVNPADDPSKKP